MQYNRGIGVAVGIVATAVVALSQAGCGGGSKNNDTATVKPGTNGNLSAVTVGPTVNRVFIGRSTPFSASWASNNPPPSEFTVRLQRYLEERGGEPRRIVSQPILIEQQGNSFQWAIRRRDGFDLDAGGAYYLQLTSPGGQEKLVTYIAGADRSQDVPGSSSGTTSRAVTQNPGTNGNLASVRIEPEPGTTFISKNTTFQLRWENGAEPPPSFEVQLRRYKEPRGTEINKDDREQAIEMGKADNSFTYSVRRRDDFDLEENGVYYLEVRAGGDILRAPYIVADH